MWRVTYIQNVWMIKCFKWGVLTCMRLAAGFLLFSKCFCLCCSWTFRAKPEPRIPYTHRKNTNIPYYSGSIHWFGLSTHLWAENYRTIDESESDRPLRGFTATHTVHSQTHHKNHHSTNSPPGLTKMLLVISSFVLKDHKSPISRKWDHLKSQDKKGLLK